MEPLRHSLVVRFGTFEVSLQSGEVRKAGVRIRVQQQPLKLLEVLLEHPGEVVTREELRSRVWPNESFGDFDQAVNIAIAKLRSALGDSAENPRYIETLPKRGYRFIAEVSFVDADGRIRRPDFASEDSTGTEPEQRLQGNGTALPLATELAHKLQSNESAVPHVPEPGPQLQGAGLAVPPKRRLPPTSRVILGLALVLGLAILCVLLVRSRGHKPAAIRSLAVLPLENLSGDAAKNYFSDGMTDELITDLAQIISLRVISRTSIMTYKGARKSQPQIARELNVDAVVEGTVLHAGDQVRITAQLIDGSTDKHLWSQSYEGDLRDTLAMQDRVARAIAKEIQINLTPQEQAALKSARVVNPQAYESYLKGRYFWNKRTADGLKVAASYFDQPIEENAKYAEA